MARQVELYEGSFANRQQTVLVISANSRNDSWPNALVSPILALAKVFAIV